MGIPRPVAAVVTGAAGVAAIFLVAQHFWPEVPHAHHDPAHESRSGATRIEGAPLCPWREPEGDLAAFFPGANRHQEMTRILSGLRLELAQRLGRNPTAEENLLRFHQVYRDDQPLGMILVQRVKGEFGAIELVVAVDAAHVVRGVRLQRQREPDEVAAAIGPAWLAGFAGKSVRDGFHPGAGLPAVPAVAGRSAQAIADGVRSLLVLLEVSASPGALPGPQGGGGSRPRV